MYDAICAAYPSQYGLTRALERSARTLVETLRAGGYKIEGLEVPVNAKAAGRHIRGFIDCLARRFAILDLRRPPTS